MADVQLVPETTVAALLERWPALEDVLVGLSPHFQALRHPVLRRTVAKVATLRHAAEVSGIPLPRLLDALRRAAGLPPLEVPDARERREAPAWARGVAPVRRFDVRPIVASGGHPADEVLSDLAALEPGDVYELVTPFVPAPLVDRARAKGLEAWSESDAPGSVRTLFRRAA